MTVKERIAHRAITKKAEARGKENRKGKGREKKTMGPGESDDDGLVVVALAHDTCPLNPQSGHSHRMDGCR